MRLIQKSSAQMFVFAAFALSVAAHAEDFRFEAKAGYDKIDFEGVDDDADLFSVSGAYYFKPVPTDGMPVAEAAYITRASYVSVVAESTQFGGEDANAFGANIGYHLPNTIFFGRLGFTQTDSSGDDDTNWNGTFGVVPIPRLFFGTDFNEEGWDPNITARYAGQFSNKRWYAASVTLTDPDEGDTNLGFAFDYYLGKFSLGGELHTGGDLWLVRAEFALPHGFALLGRVYGADGVDGIGLTLTWRDL